MRIVVLLGVLLLAGCDGGVGQPVTAVQPPAAPSLKLSVGRVRITPLLLPEVILNVRNNSDTSRDIVFVDCVWRTAGGEVIEVGTYMIHRVAAGAEAYGSAMSSYRPAKSASCRITGSR